MSYGANVNLGGEIYPKSIGYVWDPIGMSYVVAQQGVGGGGGPTTILDGADVTQGAKADLAWDGSALTATIVAILKYAGQRLEAIRTLLAGTLTMALPTGASTAANQATAVASLASIDGRLANPLPVTGPLSDTQLRATPVPVSNATLPLPAGAATDLSVATLDADLKAELGVVGASPGAFTVLDRLNQIGLKLDKSATEVTMQRVLAALNKPPVVPARSTLLHR